jgi:transposase
MSLSLPDGRSESNDVLEALRLRAIHARELGYAVVDIAAILGVREETVSRWCVKYEKGGEEALPGDRTGRPVGSGRRLDAEQEESIQDLIDSKTPQELGIASALWTRQAVQELIEKQTSQSIPIRTVGEYLSRWGYTPQKPVRKAYKQDPEEVEKWLEKTYPQIEKRAAEEDAEIHWGDETGVRSTCQHSRGYATRAESAWKSLQCQYDFDDYEPRQGALDDLCRHDERRIVYRIFEAAAIWQTEEDISNSR